MIDQDDSMFFEAKYGSKTALLESMAVGDVLHTQDRAIRAIAYHLNQGDKRFISRHIDGMFHIKRIK